MSDGIDYEFWAEEEAQFIAAEVLHHIDKMYPGMWKPVAKTARMSIRNTIRGEVSRLLMSDELATEIKAREES